MDKTLKKFTEERCFVQKMRIGVKKQTPFRKERAFFRIVLDYHGASALCFDRLSTGLGSGTLCFHRREAEGFAVGVVGFEAIGSGSPLDGDSLRLAGDVSLVLRDGLLEDVAC